MNRILKKFTLFFSIALLTGILGCTSKEKEIKEEQSFTDNEEKTLLMIDANDKGKPSVSSAKPSGSRPIAELEPVPDDYKHSDIKVIPIGRPFENDKSSDSKDDKKDKDDGS